MRLSLRGLALAGALLWGGALLLLGLTGLVVPGYGSAFLDGIASVYPGYHPGTGVGSVLLGTVYALCDGAVGGVVLAWLYNRLA